MPRKKAEQDPLVRLLEDMWPKSSNIVTPLIKGAMDEEMALKFYDEPRRFIESFLKIKTKAGEIRPLIFNYAQRYLYGVIQARRRQGKSVRIIILKGRQLGMSTLVEAYLYTRARFRRNSNCMIVAHETSPAEKIFEMTTFFYDQTPVWMRYPTSRRTRGMIKFENTVEAYRDKNPGLMSELQIATAKNVNIGRGHTLQMVHLSEIAAWANQERTFQSIMQAVPDQPETIAIIESTAQGANDFFHSMWDDAVAGEGWIPVFLPFYADPEYVDVIGDEVRTEFETDLTPYERDLMERCHGLTLEHLAWRRRIVRENCGGSVILFNQEYAPTPAEAFVAKGETIFDLEAVNWYVNNCMRGAAMRGRLTEVRGRVVFTEDPAGYLEVWHSPEYGVQYVIGADSALGQRAEEQKATRFRKRSDPDYSAAVVLSIHRRQCAQVRDRNIDPTEYAEVLALVGKWYNTALIMPEVGGDAGGYGTLHQLKKVYPRIARWKRWDDYRVNVQTNALGFEVTTSTRPILLAVLMGEIRRGAGMADHVGGKDDVPRLEVYSSDLLSELSTFSLNAGGIFGAPRGAHDDLVVALGLALLALDDLPPPPAAGADAPQVVSQQDVWYSDAEDLAGTDEYPEWAN